MGRWDKKKKKYTLKKDIQNKLDGFLKKGQASSRDEDKKSREDLTKDKIYSFVTYKNYKASCYKLVDYLFHNNKEVRQLKDLKIDHVNNYLQHLIDQGYSAPTINSSKAAIAKLMQISSKEFIATPMVQRADITRSRKPVTRDKHISEKTEAFFAKFTTAIGGRRSEMENIRGTDLVYKDLKIKFRGKTYIIAKNYPCIHIKNGKGGKQRLAPIFGKDKKETQEIIAYIKKAGSEKVFGKLPSHFDNHFYRGQYAKRSYKKLARNTVKIADKKDIYFCRKDRAGTAWDKRAMLVVSKFLGHNRIDVIARHYLY